MKQYYIWNDKITGENNAVEFSVYQQQKTLQKFHSDTDTKVELIQASNLADAIKRFTLLQD